MKLLRHLVGIRMHHSTRRQVATARTMHNDLDPHSDLDLHSDPAQHRTVGLTHTFLLLFDLHLLTAV